jgi:hypothetical protein
MARQGTNIEIRGVKETMAALKAFEPDLLKSLRKDIRHTLEKTRDAAQGKYPKGAYGVRISARKLLGSVVAMSGGGSVASSWEKSAPGVRAAIFEFAGKVQGGKTPQASGLIRSLNARYGSPGRFLWSAWDEHGKESLEHIKVSVQNAERDLQAKLDSAGESY